jgi:hypothetical protein
MEGLIRLLRQDRKEKGRRGLRKSNELKREGKGP